MKDKVKIAYVIFLNLIFMGTAFCKMFIGKTAIERAHQYYVEGNCEEGFKILKSILQSNNRRQPLHKNAVNLFDALKKQCISYLQQAKLPDDVSRLSFSKMHIKEPSSLYYLYSIKGVGKPDKKIESLELTSGSGKRLLNYSTDQASRFGEWDSKRNDKGNEEFELSSFTQDSPLELGVYHINLRMAGGANKSIWFVLNETKDQELPKLLVPKNGDNLKVSNPIVRWEKPLIQEAGHIRIHVHKLPYREFNPIWSLYDVLERIPSARIGSGKNKEDKKLLAGKYWLSLSFRKIEHWGELEIVDVSTAKLGFQVLSSF